MHARHFILLAVMVSWLIMLVLPVQAQESTKLSAEELALLERALDARATVKQYTSYVEDATIVEDQTITTSTQGLIYTVENITTTQRTANVNLIDGEKNISATLTALSDHTETFTVESEATAQPTFTADDQQNDEAESSAMQFITAEARLVNGTLYVLAECPLCALMGSEEVPTGWVTVHDADQYPALRSLYLDYFFDSPSTLNQRDALRAQADSVKLAAEQTEDGLAVEAIYVTFNADSTAALLASSLGPDALSVKLFEEGSNESGLQVKFSINSDGQLVGLAYIMVIDLPETSNPAFTGGMTDTTAGSHYVYSTLTTYRQINQPLEPAAAPE